MFIDTIETNDLPNVLKIKIPSIFYKFSKIPMQLNEKFNSKHLITGRHSLKKKKRVSENILKPKPKLMM